jgi:hypothetical protein
VAAIVSFLGDRARLRKALKSLGIFGAELDLLSLRGSRAAALLENTPAEDLQALCAALVMRIEIGEESLSISFRSVELQRFLRWDGNGKFHGRPADWACSSARYDLEIPVCAISAERWPVINISPRDQGRTAAPDRKLVALMRSAREAQRLMEVHRDETIEQLAKRLDRRPGHFSRLLRLNYLAPDIVTAIIDGSHPSGLDSNSLLRANLPMDWALQRKLLGFTAPRRELTPRKLFQRGLWPHANTSA